MATILLIIIYIAFMGMGVPDSLFGAAWPAIYKKMEIPIGWASYITVIIAIGTIISSLNTTKMVYRFGTAKVTLISTAMTAVSILGFSFSHHFIWLCIFSIPIGFGAGAIDVALNNYVALHYKASHINFMQCFYGIGVSISPFLMSLTLSKAYDWNQGYRIAFLFQAVITIIILLSLPLWKQIKHMHKDKTEYNIEKQKPLPIKKLLKDKNIRTACIMCFATCGLESICVSWGSTFLVEAKHVTIDLGAGLIIFYYIGVTTGRFFAGLIANKINSWNLIKIAEIITFAGIILLFVPGKTIYSVIGLFLLGFNAILAPNILYLAPKSFGIEISQSVTGIEMAAMYLGVLAFPALFGLLTQILPITAYPIYIAVIFIILVFSTISLKRGLHLKK